MIGNIVSSKSSGFIGFDEDKLNVPVAKNNLPPENFQEQIQKMPLSECNSRENILRKYDLRAVPKEGNNFSDPDFGNASLTRDLLFLGMCDVRFKYFGRNVANLFKYYNLGHYDLTATANESISYFGKVTPLGMGLMEMRGSIFTGEM